MKCSRMGINPFKPNGISHCYQLSNSGDPGQNLHSVASDMGLHCFPMCHKKDARLIWVKGQHCLLLQNLQGQKYCF